MSLRPLACVVLVLLVSGGCRDREITAYRAPKDPVAALPDPAASGELPADHPPVGNQTGGDATMANTAVPTGSDSLTWTAPAHWTAKPVGPMRKGSYAIKGDDAEADLSVTAFPGDTGGLLANINRWRGQISLPPLASDQLNANLTHLDIGTLHVEVVDFVGTANGTPTRILGAVVPHGSETWFFKLLGPDPVVAREKAAFLEFLRTVRPR
ncbi:MAG TPA: hypothetical protein PLQ52_05855 [Lacunisphaera sp.]|jgi:hypothetical protein|nr:hypothetical protein [Lacunisphaera sp.]